MINFIICEDNPNVREIDERIISRIAMPQEFNYKVYSFGKYSIKLKNLISSLTDTKIYILDIELPGKTGLEIAKEIRRYDWDSFIIILTSHNELELTMLKQKLLIFDFISKFDNYQNKLLETITIILDNLNIQKILTITSNKELHNLKIENILYIYRDNNLQKTKIVTNDNEYLVRESISNIVKKLDNRFYQSHRACYINTHHIKSVDFINGIICFEGGKSIDYLSRNCKKGLKQICQQKEL